MKKILCVLIAVIIATFCTVSVSAAEFSGYAGNNTEVGSGEIEINAYQYSHFNISIPETIDTSNMGSGEISVTDASLEDNFAIYVAVTNYDENYLIPMQHKTKPTITSKLSLSGNYSNYKRRDILARFTLGELADGNGTVRIGGNMVYDAPAGEYSGTVTYSISCTENTDGY